MENRQHNSPAGSAPYRHASVQHKENERTVKRQPYYPHISNNDYSINNPQFHENVYSSSTFGQSSHGSHSGRGSRGSHGSKHSFRNNHATSTQLTLTWSVGTALFVILILHFLGNSNRTYGPRSELHSPQKWRDMISYAFELIQGYVSSFFGIFSRLKPYIISPNRSTTSDSEYPFSQNEDTRGYVYNCHERKRSDSLKLPDLEVISEIQESMLSPSTSAKSTSHILEPAFLSENEYPDGWMVYDEILSEIVPFFPNNRNMNAVNTCMTSLEEEKKEREDFNGKYDADT